MTLLSAPSSHSAYRFCPPVSGLRSLLAAPDAAVVTRAAAAASRRCGADRGRDDVASIDADDGERVQPKTEEEEERVDTKKAEEDGERNIGEEEDEEGCWVSYGRRRPRRRRLPPPIPSLAARGGALRRTRTDDGRLVIRVVPVTRPENVRARRRGGRITMQLVERHDDELSPMALPPLPPPIGARGDGDVKQVDDGTSAPALGECVDDEEEEAVVAPEDALPPAVPLRRAPSVGCFEDVFKYDPIAGSSLHQMCSLRMVH
ncbi:hypothetical protein ACP70R_027808 [Stipagrostis hirtigluma subsp. patula]